MISRKRLIVYKCSECGKENATSGQKRSRCMFCHKMNNLKMVEIVAKTTKTQAILNEKYKAPDFIAEFVFKKYNKKKKDS